MTTAHLDGLCWWLVWTSRLVDGEVIVEQDTVAHQVLSVPQAQALRREHSRSFRAN